MAQEYRYMREKLAGNETQNNLFKISNNSASKKDFQKKYLLLDRFITHLND